MYNIVKQVIVIGGVLSLFAIACVAQETAGENATVIVETVILHNQLIPTLIAIERFEDAERASVLAQKFSTKGGVGVTVLEASTNGTAVYALPVECAVQYGLLKATDTKTLPNGTIIPGQLVNSGGYDENGFKIGTTFGMALVPMSNSVYMVSSVNTSNTVMKVSLKRVGSGYRITGVVQDRQ